MKAVSRLAVVSSVVAVCSMSCGGARTEPAATGAPVQPPQPASPMTSEPAPAPLSQSEPAPSSAPSTEPASPSAPSVAQEPPPEEQPQSEIRSQRDVKYVVSPEGLRVLADGVAFTPKATAVRVGAGWGLQISVQARSEDDATHSLLAPKSGQIAFAGEVRRAGQADAAEQFSDRREGDQDLSLKPQKAIKLAREWPQKGGPAPLAEGDELRLEIGIWGLGADAGSRRPLNKLARIEVKFDKGRPRVKVTAPAGISK